MNTFIVPQILTAITLFIFFINILFPAMGFIFWFFAGFFMIFVLIPSFLVLTVLHIRILSSNKQRKKKLFRKVDILPWVTVALCLVSTGVVGHNHWNEPFYDDAFDIRVEFFPDGSCEILFEGKFIGSRNTHRYDWFHHKLGDSTCHNDEGGASVMIHFDAHQGVYSIYDTQGGMANNGGALFDDDLGSKYSHSPLSTVYWDFVDGEVAVLSIGDVIDTSKSGYLRVPSLSVVVKAIGKRKFRGP